MKRIDRRPAKVTFRADSNELAKERTQKIKEQLQESPHQLEYIPYSGSTTRRRPLNTLDGILQYDTVNPKPYSYIL